MRRLLTSLSVISLLLLMTAPTALANNDGRGFYGETNDVAVTNAGFLLILFFPLLIFVLSMIQWRLEKRKDERMEAAQRRRSSPEWRGGW